MHQEGPHLGLPTLRSLLPQLPRCQWIDLQREYRRWWKREHRCGMQELDWRRDGAVWAVDFSDPPQPVDGCFPEILAVRDLASGMQLAWLPTPDEQADTAIAVLAELFVEHGAPLVLKSDNGSAFQSRAWERLLAKWQVIPLYSPPRTPRYNGGCEAGNGSMKVRTTMLAAANNRGGRWSCDDLEGARQQANELTRRDKPTTPTSAQRWSLRTRFETEDRLRFQIALDEQREKVHNQTVEGVGDKPPTLHEKARDERKAVTQALQELGLLSVTWRSVSLPISAKKVASIM